MPIENISFSQKQERLFGEKLSIQLNRKNKLYKLRDLVNWSKLEALALAKVEIKQFGRNKKDHRVMLGLSMLQAMYNGCDSFTEEELKENIYIGNIFAAMSICNKILTYRRRLYVDSAMLWERKDIKRF